MAIIGYDKDLEKTSLTAPTPTWGGFFTPTPSFNWGPTEPPPTEPPPIPPSDEDENAWSRWWWSESKPLLPQVHKIAKDLEILKSRLGLPSWLQGLNLADYLQGKTPSKFPTRTTPPSRPTTRTIPPAPERVALWEARQALIAGLPPNFNELMGEAQIEMLAQKGYSADEVRALLANNPLQEKPYWEGVVDETGRLLSRREFAQAVSNNPFQTLWQVSFLGGSDATKAQTTKSMSAAALANLRDIEGEAGQIAKSDWGMRQLEQAQLNKKAAFDQEKADILQRGSDEGQSADEILTKLLAAYYKFSGGDVTWDEKLYSDASRVAAGTKPSPFGLEEQAGAAQAAWQLARFGEPPPLLEPVAPRPPKWWTGAVPSLQQWATIPWTEREQLRLYLESIGVSWRDLLESMARGAPEAPSWAPRWSPARARLGV